MSNGFIRHKIVQWVFKDKYELFAFNPRTEGVYALDNYYGDIYVWNGNKWMLYAKDVITVERLRQPQPDNWKRLLDLPTFRTAVTSSAAGQWTGSAGFMVCDVNIYPSNFIENVNVYDDRSYVGYKTFISASVFVDGIGYVVTASAWAPPPSGSFYTTVSTSIA